MPLIKCPECGKMISEFATHCIECGCPMDVIKKLIEKQNQDNNEIFKQPVSKETTLLREKLTLEEATFIETIKRKIERSYPCVFSFSDTLFYIGITTKGSDKYLFTFKKPENILLFRYPSLVPDMFIETEVCYFNDKMVDEILNIVRKRTPELKKSKESKPVLTFLDLLTDSQTNLLDDFDSKLKVKIPIFKVVDTRKKRTYKIKHNGTHSLCRIVKKGKNKIIVRFYSSVISSSGSNSATLDYLSLDTVIDAIYIAYKRYISPQSQNEPKQITEDILKRIKFDDGVSSNEKLSAHFLDIEKELVKEFETNILSKHQNIARYESESRIAYKMKNKDTLLFWFTIDENQLVFKYLKFSSERKPIIASVYAGERGAKRLISLAEQTISDTLANSSKAGHLLPINEQIKKAITNSSFRANDKFSTLAKAVADFTTDWLFEKYKELKRFETKEEFNRYKNKYYDYTYHGRPFSFKYVSDTDAELYFKYYIAAQLISVIQRYEATLNTKIIENPELLIDEYYSLIDKKDNSFNSVKGVNSNIQFVPLTVLEEESQKYYL